MTALCHRRSGANSSGAGNGCVVTPRFVAVNALPPNKGMELTVLLGTPLQREEQGQRRVTLQLIPGARQLVA